MSAARYTVQVNDFSGPIDVLLGMIEQRKLAINDISLAQVTDEFIAFIDELEDVQPQMMTHFILVASTLMLIKSRSLLPTLELTEEEQGDVEALQDRLRLFQSFESSFNFVRNKSAESRTMHERPFSRRRRIVFSPDESNMQLSVLREALAQVVMNFEHEREKLPEARVRVAVHIEDMMERLKARMQVGLFSFSETVRPSHHGATYQEHKVHAVVGFLAILEMIHKGILRAQQIGTFDDIALQSL